MYSPLICTDIYQKATGGFSAIKSNNDKKASNFGKEVWKRF